MQSRRDHRQRIEHVAAFIEAGGLRETLARANLPGSLSLTQEDNCLLAWLARRLLEVPFDANAAPVYHRTQKAIAAELTAARFLGKAWDHRKVSRSWRGLTRILRPLQQRRIQLPDDGEQFRFSWHSGGQGDRDGIQFALQFYDRNERPLWPLAAPGWIRPLPEPPLNAIQPSRGNGGRLSEAEEYVRATLFRGLGHHHLSMFRSWVTNDDLRPPRRVHPYGAAIFLMDESFQQGHPSALLSPGFYAWHQGLASLSMDLQSRRLTSGAGVKRIVPLYREDHSAEEIELIKFCIHYLLVFGVEVLAAFTEPPPDTMDHPPPSFLRRHFGSNNRTIHAAGRYVDADQLYEKRGRLEPLEVTSPDEAREVVESSLEAIHSIQCHALSYNALTFTSKYDQTLHLRFGDFLAELQGGRCAIGYDHAIPHPGHVDHVLPPDAHARREERGLPWSGNNALPNLRVVCDRLAHRPEALPSIRSTTLVRPPLPESAFPKPSLADLALLADRRLQPVQIGPQALETGWFARKPGAR